MQLNISLLLINVINHNYCGPNRFRRRQSAMDKDSSRNKLTNDVDWVAENNQWRFCSFSYCIAVLQKLASW